MQISSISGQANKNIRFYVISFLSSVVIFNLIFYLNNLTRITFYNNLLFKKYIIVSFLAYLFLEKSKTHDRSSKLLFYLFFLSNLFLIIL
jgi:hypothetical protein